MTNSTAHPKPPEFGPTGSRVTAFEVKIEHDWQRNIVPPPRPPEMSIYRYDDDTEEFVYERERTPEEFAEAMQSYEKARAEWDRTGGVYMTQGPTIVSVKIVCEDGTRAEGFLTGDEWRWSKWETKSAAVGNVSPT